MLRRTHLGLLALACALALPALAAPGAFAATCAVNLDDSSGLEWDLQDDGWVEDGEDDAYNGLGFVWVAQNRTDDSRGYLNPDPAGCTYEDGGREVVFPTSTNVGSLGVDVQRKVYVPSSGPAFARFFDVITNPTSETKTITYEYYTIYGDVGSVSGDANGNAAVDVGERWASFVQDGSDSGDTEFSSLWDGPGGDGWDRPYYDDEDFVPGDAGDQDADYMYDDVVLRPGETATFMHVEHQNVSVEGAREFAEQHQEGTAPLFAGLSEAEIAALRNWNVDRDGDGVPSYDENCPAVANADQGDVDGDGLGDACDDDVDGDGLTNAQEGGLGTNPRAVDTDGDGVVDGLDPCGTRAGADGGCPPLAAPPSREPAAAASSSTPAGPAPAPQPVVLPRLAPTRVTLSVRRTRPSAGRIRLRSAGRVLLPAGVAPEQGCAAGSVVVSVTSGGDPLAARVANLDPSCRYVATVTFDDPRRPRSRPLVVRAHFSGNDRLTRRSSSRVGAGRA